MNRSQPINLTATDLNAQGGIYCPNKLAGMDLWNSHPRVYLDIARTGQATCPYCATQYQNTDGTPDPAIKK